MLLISILFIDFHVWIIVSIFSHYWLIFPDFLVIFFWFFIKFLCDAFLGILEFFLGFFIKFLANFFYFCEFLKIFIIFCPIFFDFYQLFGPILWKFFWIFLQLIDFICKQLFSILIQFWLILWGFFLSNLSGNFKPISKLKIFKISKKIRSQVPLSRRTFSKYHLEFWDKFFCNFYRILATNHFDLFIFGIFYDFFFLHFLHQSNLGQIHIRPIFLLVFWPFFVGTNFN